MEVQIFHSKKGLCLNCIYHEIRRHQDGEYHYNSELFDAARLVKDFNVQRLVISELEQNNYL